MPCPPLADPSALTWLVFFSHVCLAQSTSFSCDEIGGTADPKPLCRPAGSGNTFPLQLEGSLKDFELDDMLFLDPSSAEQHSML
jgi:hypothetical protein